MSKKKKVLIIEPSHIIVEGLTKIIGGLPQIELVTPFYDIENIESRLISIKPDILIINPAIMPYSIYNPVNIIRNVNKQTILVALVYQYVENNILRSFDRIIDIRDDKDRICLIIKETCLYDTEITEESDDGNYELSKRETDVLVLIAKGLMNKEIADMLNISVHTVISHRKHITRKTNIKSAAGLSMYAYMNNLLEESSV